MLKNIYKQNENGIWEIFICDNGKYPRFFNNVPNNLFTPYFANYYQCPCIVFENTGKIYWLEYIKDRTRPIREYEFYSNLGTWAKFLKVNSVIARRIYRT